MAVNDKALRKQLVWLLESRDAHVSLDDALRGLPAGLRGKKPAGAAHTPWQILEHIRLAQWDILEFSRDPNHASLPFPDGYWPATEAPPSARDWQKSIAAIHRDLRLMIRLVEDPKTDLFARIPHGDGQTVLREAMLIADHTAYHAGELVTVRRLLGCWPH